MTHGELFDSLANELTDEEAELLTQSGDRNLAAIGRQLVARQKNDPLPADDDELMRNLANKGLIT